MNQLDEYQSKAVNIIRTAIQEDGNKTLAEKSYVSDENAKFVFLTLSNLAINERYKKAIAKALLRIAFDRLDNNSIPSPTNELRTNDNGRSYERKYIRSDVAYFGGDDEDFAFSDDPKVAVLIDAFNVLTRGERLDIND